jgi:hypothetical protein
LQAQIFEKDAELFKSLNQSNVSQKKEENDKDLFSSTLEISKKEQTIEDLKKKVEESQLHFCNLDSELIGKNLLIS